MWWWLYTYPRALLAAIVVWTLLGAACLLLRNLARAYAASRRRRRLPLVPLWARSLARRECLLPRLWFGVSALDGGHLPLFLTVWLAGFVLLALLACHSMYLYRADQAGLFFALICLLLALVAATLVTLLCGNVLRKLCLLACVVLAYWGAYAPAAFLLLVAVVSKVWQYDGAARMRQSSNTLYELAEALRLKLPLDTVFEALGREQPGRWAAQMETAAARLRKGEALSAALDQPGLLPPYATAAIRAGENGGGGEVAEVARAVAEELRQEAQARSIVGSALLYPFTVWVACMPFALFLACGPAQRFGEMALGRFEDPSLAWWLKLLAFATEALPYAIGTVGAAVLLFVSLRDSDWWARTWHALAWRLADLVPLFRGRLRHHCLARCARGMAALLKGGAPFHKTWQLLGTPAMAGPFAGAFRRVGGSLELGRPIKEAMHGSGLPSSFGALIQLGSAGGELEAALQTAAEWHEARAERLDHALGVTLTCVSLLLVALMIGSIAYIVFSTLGAACDIEVRGIHPWK